MILRIGLLLSVAAAGTVAAWAQPASQVRQRTADERAARSRIIEARGAAQQQAMTLARELDAQLAAGTATPPAQAAASAAERGDFGLMATAGRFGVATAPGLMCFTPRRQAPRVRALYRWGDSVDEAVSRWFDYAAAYNRVLAARPGYPDDDLCRLAADRESEIRWDIGPATTAARPVSGSPRTLHEAARRGSADDVRRLLQTNPVDGEDELEMTPLAWAVARNNRPAAEALLAAGADPWAGPDEWGGLPVYIAAALGRDDWFAALAERPGRPFARWSNFQLRAALSGGNRAILAQMLREPHDPVRGDPLSHPLPSAELAEMLLADGPGLADTLLRLAAESESRADLVRLALAHGANPNAAPLQTGRDTPLGSAATGIGADSLTIVDLLLRAGADPDAFSWRARPLWVAAGILKLDDRIDEIDGRATAIFHRLLASGANINLPDSDGVPPIRTLLFPYRWDHRRLDASFVTPALLDMLARAGLDLNARWQGERVLGPVEAQAGRNSELAVTLRRLGARR